MSIVTGLFKDRDSAERAYKSATEAGYKSTEIDVVMSEETRERYYGKNKTLETEVGSKAAEGAAIGGGVGATAGAIAAAIAAAGTGGVAGGLVGALIGWGIPEDTLKEYEQGVSEGGILIGVKPRSQDDARRFERDWRDNQGVGVSTY